MTSTNPEREFESVGWGTRFDIPPITPPPKTRLVRFVDEAGRLSQAGRMSKSTVVMGLISTGCSYPRALWQTVWSSEIACSLGKPVWRAMMTPSCWRLSQSCPFSSAHLTFAVREIASYSARTSDLRVRSGSVEPPIEAFQCCSSSSRSGRRHASHSVLCGCCLKYWRIGNIPPLFRRRIGPSPPTSPRVRWGGMLWIARHPA